MHALLSSRASSPARFAQYSMNSMISVQAPGHPLPLHSSDVWGHRTHHAPSRCAGHLVPVAGPVITLRETAAMTVVTESGHYASRM